ncbi:MAG TPA: alanine racemase [Nitrospinota bacterium]|nr:alanine racemase [Nitrospinota bacterium]
MQNTRSTFVEIDLDAFKENLLKVRAKVGSGIKILAVVKADAYGHGAFLLSKKALEVGADMLGVTIVEEGIELREKGIDAPILVMGGALENQVKYIIDYNLSFVLFSRRIADLLSSKAKEKGKVVKVHIKIDTGMRRLGIPCNEAVEFIKRIRDLQGIDIEGILTHLSCADEIKSGFTDTQLSSFNKVLKEIDSIGLKVPLIHAANSAAIINYPESYFSMVRPGIMLYGSCPGEKKRDIELKPVMAWKTRIIDISKVGKGEGIGYGQRYFTKRKSTIATLPVGYTDGYSRLLSNKGKVIIHGKKVPIVGTICMDMCMVDVSDIPNAKVGDEVVLMGRQENEKITAEEIADLMNTISYEVFCKVSKRVPRVYKERKVYAKMA